MTPERRALCEKAMYVYTADGEPVERVHTHYRSDIYCLDVHLTRDPAGTPSTEGWTLRGKRAAN